MDGILSIQSQVVFGHVGNGAAQFALQALGHEVWALPTVLFSNHPGHGGFTGHAATPGTLSELVAGLETRGLLGGCRAVLSGYLGAAGQVDVVVDALERTRKASPNALYCCDPVIGDAPKGTYVRAGIPEGIAERLLPLADILTPNAFELSVLAGRAVDDPKGAHEAARSLGCPLTVVTSVPLPGRADRLGTLAVTGDGAWLCVATRLSRVPPGTGDLLTALFLGHLLRGADVPGALSRAVSGVDAVLRFGAGGSLPELPLIAAQDQFRGAAGVQAIEAMAFSP